MCVCMCVIVREALCVPVCVSGIKYSDFCTWGKEFHFVDKSKAKVDVNTVLLPEYFLCGLLHQNVND